MGRSSQHTDRLVQLLGEVKLLAREYYELEGRPLGVTGEIAEYEAAQLLGLELSAARQAGYDATRPASDGGRERVQIKGRRMLPGSKGGQRLGRMSLSHPWDVAVLVLLDESFTATEIFEADRTAIEGALTEPGSRARNERRQLSVSRFKAIGKRVYPAGPSG